MVAGRLLPLCLCALAFAAAARADERPRVDAVRTTGPIKVDGVLDEPDWTRATPIRDLRLIFVREGQAPCESTDVRVLFDDTRIYFGIRCENRGPGRIRASVTPRDGILDDDFVAIHLDTYRDFHRAYMFGVNPFGVQLDGILTGGDVNLDWDGVWDAEARRDSAGWSAEIAVPLRILRFPDHGTGVWGLWIRRTITKNAEIASWPLWKQSVPGDIMLQAADLGGLAGLIGGGRVEVQPYATSTQTAWRTFQPLQGSLGPWDHENDQQAGVDVKFSPTATLVLNGTINPDYSQVEADALQFDVNQRFPLLYPEKRPFFLEGADFFSAPIDLVYTRRIADPDYGLKATGTIGHLRIGGLVVRDAGLGSLEGVGDGPREGLSSRGTFEIGRASYEIGEQSSVGVLLAGHQSDLSLVAPPGDLSGTIPGAAANLVVAGDCRVRLAKPLYFTGQIARSSTHADTATFGILPGDTIPPTGTSRYAGVAYRSELSWSDGVRNLELTHEYYGPGYRNESGFLERTDVRHSEVEADVMVRPENAWIRSWQPILEGSLYHDPEGPLQEWYVSPMIDWEFQKQTHVHTMLERVNERWHGRFYEQTHYILDADNSLWRALAVGVTSYWGNGIFYGPTDATSYRGWVASLGATATWRPSPRLTSQITVTRNLFWRPDRGPLVYDIWQSGAKTTFQFTRRFYARIYPQYDSGTQHLEADGLLAYVVHPGTVFYLGMNSGVDPVFGRREMTERTLFLKASYAWVR